MGLDPASLAGHSLRSGFLTSTAEAGASIWKISEVSHHKSLDTLRGYVRRVDQGARRGGFSAIFPWVFYDFPRKLTCAGITGALSTVGRVVWEKNPS
jgi:hypothetical protein